MAGTDATTEDDIEPTDETLHGTDSGTPAKYSFEPPCREAARCLVRCPQCERQVQIRTLKYSHMCSRSFNPLVRAVEQKEAAESACRARQARHDKQTQEHAMEQTRTVIHPMTQTQERHLGQAADKRKSYTFAIC